MELNYEGLKIVDMELNFSFSYPSPPLGRGYRTLNAPYGSFKQNLEALVATETDPALVKTCKELGLRAEAVGWNFETLCQELSHEKSPYQQQQ